MLINAKRMPPELRKQHIIEQGLVLARKGHYLLFTRAELAAACNVSPGLINVYAGNVDNIRQDVLRMAVERKVVEVVAQGLVQHDPIVNNIDKELKRKAIEFIEG